MGEPPPWKFLHLKKDNSSSRCVPTYHTLYMSPFWWKWMIEKHHWAKSVAGGQNNIRCTFPLAWFTPLISSGIFWGIYWYGRPNFCRLYRSVIHDTLNFRAIESTPWTYLYFGAGQPVPTSSLPRGSHPYSLILLSQAPTDVGAWSAGLRRWEPLLRGEEVEDEEWEVLRHEQALRRGMSSGVLGDVSTKEKEGNSPYTTVRNKPLLRKRQRNLQPAHTDGGAASPRSSTQRRKKTPSSPSWRARRFSRQINPHLCQGSVREASNLCVSHWANGRQGI